MKNDSKNSQERNRCLSPAVENHVTHCTQNCTLDQSSNLIKRVYSCSVCDDCAFLRTTTRLFFTDLNQPANKVYGVAEVCLKRNDDNRLLREPVPYVVQRDCDMKKRLLWLSVKSRDKIRRDSLKIGHFLSFTGKLQIQQNITWQADIISGHFRVYFQTAVVKLAFLLH